jgi:CRP-like cAMP-binding protein
VALFGRPDPRKLKNEATEMVSKGKWKRALDIYLELEKLEPNDGAWPQRAGDAARRLGKPADAVTYLRRAADAYAKHGFLLKAVAVCKVILEIDPRQRDVEDRLATFSAARASTVFGKPTPLPTMLRVPDGAPLAEVPLAQVVPNSRASSTLPLSEEANVYEIPIDEITVDPEMERLMAQSPSVATARTALGKTPLFSSLDEARLRLLITRCRLKSLAEDEVLFRRGDAGDNLYVIADGEIAVLHADEKREVKRLHDGDFFGELAIMTDQPRSNTVRATVSTEVLAIDRATIADLVADSPRVLKTLLRFVRDRLLENLILVSPLFSPFSGADQKELAARFEFVEAEPGAMLMRTTEIAPAMMIILCGTVEVRRKNQRLAELGQGEVLGALSLLTMQPVGADVFAKTKLFLLLLPRSLFHEVILTHPQVLEHVNTIAEARRKQLETWLGRSSLV